MKAEKCIASNTTLAKILKVEPHTAQSGLERLEKRHPHAQRRTALGRA
jgi:Mn-dependent DtxR family transcriptional regulator